MNGKNKADGDEIMYLDEIHDEVSRPLTAAEVPYPPTFGLRAGFVSPEEAEQGDHDSRGPALLTETEDEHEGMLEKPSAPQAISFESRNGPEVPAGSTDFLNSVFSSSVPPTVQVVTPDVNVYQHKKTLAQGMMDLALLSANANQMRYVLQTDGRHPYFFPSLIMIGMSLFLQIAVGIGLIWNSVYDVKEHEQMCKANKANNWTVIGIFLVTILNVFISSFGVVDQTVVVTT